MRQIITLKNPAAADIRQALSNIDVLTEVQASYDVPYLKNKGLLNNPADFTNERFFQSVQSHMIACNGTMYKITFLMLFDEQPTDVSITIKVRKKGDKFTYTYKNVSGYLSLSFKGTRFLQAVAKYYFSKKFREFVRECIREFAWRSTPVFQ